MKLFLSTALIMLSALSAMGNPLVFKTTKEIRSTNDFVEVATLDTAKYSRFRVHIVNADSKTAASNFYVWIKAIEDTDDLLLVMDSGEFMYNYVCDTPPARSRILIKGNGVFKVFIWAS